MVECVMQHDIIIFMSESWHVSSLYLSMVLKETVENQIIHIELKFPLTKEFNCYFYLRELSQITFAFFGIFGPGTSLVCTFYVVNYTFF